MLIGNFIIELWIPKKLCRILNEKSWMEKLTGYVIQSITQKQVTRH